MDTHYVYTILYGQSSVCFDIMFTFRILKYLFQNILEQSIATFVFTIEEQFDEPR